MSAATGFAAGAVIAWLVPGDYQDGVAVIPLWLVAPFALMLGSIAIMPLAGPGVWHRHFPDFAFVLGAFVIGYYVLAFGAPGAHSHGVGYGPSVMLHTFLEYYSFIAVVGGLYVVSGGILIDIRPRSGAGPAVNTAILGVGAVIANVVGTTGASMLLIRPFLRVNRGRLRPIHVVFFIFVVSNCGGCLTPLGDPPLYLGYLKGVPFFWVPQHLWYDWAFTVGALLAVFFVVDRRIGPAPPPMVEAVGGAPVSIRGAAGLVCLGLMLAAVFMDAVLTRVGVLQGVPVTATCLLVIACSAWLLAPRRIHEANGFRFFPVKEVGILFLGIFATMAPALGYLSVHGRELGIHTPTAFYFATGSLSALLDNAPAYLNFLQVALADPEINPLAPAVTAVNPQTVRAALGDAAGVLALNAISTGAVFFGAMTYIGNGPNFMVKAIAEDGGVRMPSFVGYVALSLAILLPVLVSHWALFIR